MIKIILFVSFSIGLYFTSFSNEIQLLQDEIEEGQSVLLLISNYSKQDSKIIIYYSISIDTLLLDTNIQAKIHKLKFPLRGSYNIIIESYDDKGVIIQKKQLKVKVNKKDSIQIFDKIWGPVLGALIATLIFVINNHLTELFNRIKQKKKFKLYINSMIDKSISENSEDYLNNILEFILKTDNPLYLPYSDKRILSKTNVIKRIILTFQASEGDFNNLLVDLKNEKF